MNKVIVSTYEDQDGKEVPEHTINVPSPEEIVEQARLNIENTTEAARRKVLENRILYINHQPHPDYRARRNYF